MVRSILVALGFVLAASGAQAADCAGADEGRQVVLFEVGSTQISAEGRKTLKAFADTAKYHTKVCVAGQADKQGDPDANKRLALKRADAVKAVLIDYGVPAKYIAVEGRGEAFGGKELFSFLQDQDSDRRVEVSYGD